MTSPPRLPRLLLRLLLPSRLRPFVLDDLAEEFLARAATEGESTACRWYWRQVVGGIRPALRLRRRAVASLFAGNVGQVAGRLHRSPAFAAVTMVTLALAIGASAAIFSLVNGILLRPLPYPEPDRLVVIKHAMPAFDVVDALQSTGTYFHYRDNASSFIDMGIYQEATVNLTGDGDAEQIGLIMATPSVFSTLGVAPLIGRLFVDSDVAAGRDPVVVLSHALWRERYGSDPSVVGGEMIINNRARRIIGVLRPEFDFPDPGARLWMSNVDVARSSARFGELTFGNVARLRAGISVAQAEAELRSLAPSLAEAYGDISAEMLEASGFSVHLVGLQEDVVGAVEGPLWMLLAAVVVVLLIAAANVANLFLVRAEYRGREVALREALGAGRIQLFAYFLSESAALCLLGGCVGVALSAAAIRLLVAVGFGNLPRLHEVAVDARVVGFAAALSLLAAVAFAFIPALRHRAKALPTALRGGSRGAASTPASQRVGRALVALQAMLAVTLMIGALLLVQSFAGLRAIDPGFDPEGVLAIDFSLPFNAYPDYERAAGFFRAVQERVKSLPEVSAASAVGDLPLSAPQFPPTAVALQVEGRLFDFEELPPVGRLEYFLPGYFETMRIELVAGTWPTTAAGPGPDNPVAINESLAHQLFGVEPAVGRRPRYFNDTGRAGPWWTVAAVAGDVLYDEITGAPPPILYLPVLEHSVHPGLRPTSMTLVARGPSTAALAPAIRAIVRDIDPDMPIVNVRTVAAVVAAATAQTSFAMVLLLTAASAAVLLGAVGIYGVASYAVGRRTQEIGVRMALGASAPQIRGMVLREGSGVLIAGLACGLMVSAWGARLVVGFLYGVSPSDPLVFVVAPLILLAIALLAMLLPARRAARIDPVRALGIE